MLRVVEEPLGAGKPERRAGDHHRLGRRAPSPATARPRPARRAVRGAGARAGGPAARAPRARRRGCGCARRAGLQLDATRARPDPVPVPRPGSPEAAQGVVERRHVALLGVVGGEADDRVVAEHVGGEALQRVLRADLDEDPRALVVERAQALDELHGRGDLAAEHVEHLLLGAVAGRVELAVDVGDDRQLRRPQAEPLRASRAAASLAGATISVWKAWLTGSGIAVCPRSCTAATARATALGGAAEHDLVGRVDVGEHDVAVGPGDDLLDLLERRHHRGHRPGVVDVGGSPSRARGR